MSAMWETSATGSDRLSGRLLQKFQLPSAGSSSARGGEEQQVTRRSEAP